MSRLLSIKRVARMLDMSEKTVRRWIKDGVFPGPTHVLPGNNQRWEEAAVNSWKAVHSVEWTRFLDTPVKGKTPGTTVDNSGQEGTSGGPEPVKSKSRI